MPSVSFAKRAETGTVSDGSGWEGCRRQHPKSSLQRGYFRSLKTGHRCSTVLCMSRLEKLEQDIAKLSPEEFVELEQWFDAERNRKWDRQIEEDVQSGKLREVYEKLKSENQGQPNTPLDEFLDNEKLS